MEGSRDGAQRWAAEVCAAHEASDGSAPPGAASARSAGPLRPAGATAHAESGSGDDAARGETSERQAGRSHPAAHVLFASGYAWRACEGDSGTGRTPGPGHDAALHALE